MPVSGAIVEKPAEKGRKTWIKFKLSIFFVNDGCGAASATSPTWANRVTATRHHDGALVMAGDSVEKSGGKN